MNQLTVEVVPNAENQAFTQSYYLYQYYYCQVEFWSEQLNLFHRSFTCSR